MRQDLQPHVIVSDIATPDDGSALLRHVMELTRARIPVIAISAERHQRIDLRRAGFIEFVL